MPEACLRVEWTTRIFRNVRGEPVTRFGIHDLLARTVAKAAQTTPSLRAKRISPHTLRHTTAVHLLRSGVDINTIRASQSLELRIAGGWQRAQGRA